MESMETQCEIENTSPKLKLILSGLTSYDRLFVPKEQHDLLKFFACFLFPCHQLFPSWSYHIDKLHIIHLWELESTEIDYCFDHACMNDHPRQSLMYDLRLWRNPEFRHNLVPQIGGDQAVGVCGGVETVPPDEGVRVLAGADGFLVA